MEHPILVYATVAICVALLLSHFLHLRPGSTMETKKRKRPRISLTVGVPCDEGATPAPATGWWLNARPREIQSGSLGPQVFVMPLLDFTGLTPRTRYANTFGEVVGTSPRVTPPGGVVSRAANPFGARNAPVCRYSVVHTRGRRRVWEDRYCVSSNFLGDRQASVFAVFDGHGGCEAAEFSARHLVSCLEKTWEADDVCEGVRRAFTLLDKLYLESLSEGSLVAERPSTWPDGTACGVYQGDEQRDSPAHSGVALRSAATTASELLIVGADLLTTANAASPDPGAPPPEADEGSRVVVQQMIGRGPESKPAVATPQESESCSADNGATADPGTFAGKKRPNPFAREQTRPPTAPQEGVAHAISGSPALAPSKVAGPPADRPKVAAAAGPPAAQLGTDLVPRMGARAAAHQGGGDVAPPSVADVDGSTALVAIVLDGGAQLVIAHVGDSRAMLMTESSVLHRTRDHTVAESPEEGARVRAAGGVLDDDGRVSGVLGMTRSIGDAWLKRGAHGTGPVIADPSVTLIDLRARGSEPPAVVVLATDGLWERMHTEEAATVVRDSFSAFRATQASPASSAPGGATESPPPDAANTPRSSINTTPTSYGGIAEPRVIAERLVAEARLRNATDDITVLVVDLRQPTLAVTQSPRAVPPVLHDCMSAEGAASVPERGVRNAATVECACSAAP